MAAVDITSLCNLPVFWCFSFFFYFWGISKFVREGFGKEGRKGRKRKETEKFGKEGKPGKENLDLWRRPRYHRFRIKLSVNHLKIALKI